MIGFLDHNPFSISYRRVILKSALAVVACCLRPAEPCKTPQNPRAPAENKAREATPCSQPRLVPPLICSQNSQSEDESRLKALFILGSVLLMSSKSSSKVKAPSIA